MNSLYLVSSTTISYLFIGEDSQLSFGFDRKGLKMKLIRGLLGMEEIFQFSLFDFYQTSIQFFILKSMRY